MTKACRSVGARTHTRACVREKPRSIEWMTGYIEGCNDTRDVYMAYLIRLREADRDG